MPVIINNGNIIEECTDYSKYLLKQVGVCIYQSTEYLMIGTLITLK